MPEFTLYSGNRNYSTWSMRAGLACALAGLEPEVVIVPLGEAATKPSILKIGPAGKLPILKHGERLIWDSLSIAEYLAELYPARGLWPADPAARAHARSLCAEMHAGFMPLRRGLPLNLKRASRVTPPIDADCQADIARVQAMWSDCGARYGGPYLFGAQPTLADAFYAPVACRFDIYGVTLSGPAAAYAKTALAWAPVRDWVALALKEPWHNPVWDR